MGVRDRRRQVVLVVELVQAGVEDVFLPKPKKNPKSRSKRKDNKGMKGFAMRPQAVLTTHASRRVDGRSGRGRRGRGGPKRREEAGERQISFTPWNPSNIPILTGGTEMASGVRGTFYSSSQ